MVYSEPRIAVGVMDRQAIVAMRLTGNFVGEGLGPFSGSFTASASDGLVVIFDGTGHEVARAPFIRLEGDDSSTFELLDVTIGINFHWERKENQTFKGDLVLRTREDATVTAINELSLEEYLQSVISSEMSATAPGEFLRAHAILSRSWLMAALSRSHTERARPLEERPCVVEREVFRWYDREDHDLFDVCADDHCQRYQGITKIISPAAREAVLSTSGIVMVYGGRVCDARYSKCCGGLTEDFATAWDDVTVPYLASVPDSALSHRPVTTEEEATRWISSHPEAYCNTSDESILAGILPDFDRETKDFFRWTVEYTTEELGEILRRKSGFDFGTVKELVPLQRGPSGRIFRLRITGSRKSVVVGKELEIRRWLSPSHLFSSAFFVETRPAGKEGPDRFVLHGAGWGHGVGLCQIGAAVMAREGFSAREILKHYFSGIAIEKVY